MNESGPSLYRDAESLMTPLPGNRELRLCADRNILAECLRYCPQAYMSCHAGRGTEGRGAMNADSFSLRTASKEGGWSTKRNFL